jgi:hypothetical protein
MTHDAADFQRKRPLYRLWPLRLVPRRRGGRWLSAALILATLLGWFQAAGVLFGSDAPESSTAAALFFAVILAYIVPVFHYITERTRAAFADIAPYLIATPAQLDAWQEQIEHRSTRWVVVVVSIGVCAWIAHTSLMYVTPNSSAGIQTTAAWFTIMAAPGLVWILMTTAIVALLNNARLFGRLARHVRIDLLDTRPLTAFARVAVSSTLAIVGAQAAFPIMLLDPRVALAASGPGLIVTTFAMAELFVLPIWPVHRAIAAAKRAELVRINAAIATITSDTPLAQDRLQALQPYLTYRREIVAVHEWPFDTGVTTRLAFYLIIPPLTWVAAALIDVAVERLL